MKFTEAQQAWHTIHHADLHNTLDDLQIIDYLPSPPGPTDTTVYTIVAHTYQGQTTHITDLTEAQNFALRLSHTPEPTNTAPGDVAARDTF